MNKNIGDMTISELKDFIMELQEKNSRYERKIDKYENPKDLTLMYMYCDEKAKDKIKDLQNRIDKAIEYINKNWDGSSYIDATLKNKVAELNITDLLEILGGKK